MPEINKRGRFRYAVFFIIPIILCVTIITAEELKERPAHFYFIQISDTHWGNGDHYDRTEKVVDMINGLPMPIKCVVHTGDITMDTLEDPSVVEKGLDILKKLKVPVHYIPGNHDILINRYPETEKAYIQHFGNMITQAEYDGVMFIMIHTEPLTRFFPVEKFQPLVELSNALIQSKGKPVIIFHHSPSVSDFYNNTMHERWKTDIQKKWESLINSHNVKAVVTGHFHRDEFHWLGNVPLFVSSSISGYWGRQASFRLYEYQNGKLGYRTQYIP